MPPGLALGHRNHVPPGLARKVNKAADDEQGDENSSGHGNGNGHSHGNGHSSHGRGNGN